MQPDELFERFRQIAGSPRAQLDSYLSRGRKVVLTAPVYTPEELIHSMGLVPMGAWGADIQLAQSKRYFPAFICSIIQSILELGMKGAYEGASAIVIPSLCDSLKCLGENWKYAVPSIPFIPMTYPQNRKPAYARAFTEAGYRRVIADLEKATGVSFDEAKLADSLAVYNAHNAAMRRFAELCARHPEVTAASRSDVFRSAFFMLKEEHTELVNALCDALEQRQPEGKKTGIVISGILTDAPELNDILDGNGLQILWDDVAAQSRQYRTDAPMTGRPMADLTEKFSAMDCCSVLYDVEKKRVQLIADEAKRRGAAGVLIVMTKFCDPEEFDYPLIRKACEAADIPCTVIEVDRQMVGLEQARTAIETFRDMIR